MYKICTNCKKEKPIKDFHKHAGGKDGHRGECKHCVCKKIKKYREENPEKIKQRKKKYYENNKEYVKTKSKKWYHDNIEYRHEYQKSYYQNNKERRRETDKIYRKNNKEKLRKARIKWEENNKEHILEYQRNYYKTEHGKLIRARKQHKRKSLEAKTKCTLTEHQWLVILQLQNYKCISCNKYFDEVAPTKDHIIPVVKKGDFTVNNVQALCQPCNSSKNSNIIDFRTTVHKDIIAQL